MHLSDGGAYTLYTEPLPIETPLLCDSAWPFQEPRPTLRSPLQFDVDVATGHPLPSYNTFAANTLPNLVVLLTSDPEDFHFPHIARRDQFLQPGLIIERLLVLILHRPASDQLLLLLLLLETNVIMVA